MVLSASILSPDGLSQWDGGGGRPQKRLNGQTAPPGQNHSHDRAEKNPAGDAEAALPHLHDVARRVGETLPLGGDVIEARADHARRNGPQQYCRCIFRTSDADRRQSTAEQPRRHQHADGDHESVGAQLDGTDVDRRTTRTGQ
jgi:hypothetical protein